MLDETRQTVRQYVPCDMKFALKFFKMPYAVEH